MKSPYYDKLPKYPTCMIIEGTEFEGSDNENIDINLDCYNKFEINVLYSALDDALYKMLDMRETRLKIQKENRERAELNRLKKKYEK